MAVRTTKSLVRNTITTTVLDDQLDQYISFANGDIDQAVALSVDFAALGVQYLIDMETLLAAHYTACLADRRATEEKYGDSSKKWQGEAAMGYESTHYGQMALKRDPTGILTAIEKGVGSATDSEVLGIG